MELWNRLRLREIFYLTLKLFTAKNSIDISNDSSQILSKSKSLCFNLKQKCDGIADVSNITQTHNDQVRFINEFLVKYDYKSIDLILKKYKEIHSNGSSLMTTCSSLMLNPKYCFSIGIIGD